MFGILKADANVVNARAHSKERLGQLLQVQGKEHTQVSDLGEGDIGAVAKLKETQTGDVLLDAERQVEAPDVALLTGVPGRDLRGDAGDRLPGAVRPGHAPTA